MQVPSKSRKLQEIIAVVHLNTKLSGITDK